MKTIRLIILITFALLFTTSCSNIKELNNISLIKHIGFSKIDNQYHLIFNIEEIKNKEKVVNSFSFKGNNLEDVYKQINYSMDKRLYIAHLNTVIIEKEIFKSDYSNIINLFTKDKNNRLDFSVYSINNELFEESMNYLKDNNSFNNLVDNSNYVTSSVSNVRFDHMLNNYYENLDFVIPEITKLNTFKIDNYIYFKNNIYFDDLNMSESMIYNYINDLVNQGVIYNVTIFDNKSIVKVNNDKISILITSKIKKVNQATIKDYKQKLENDINSFIAIYMKNIKEIKCNIKVEVNNYE